MGFSFRKSFKIGPFLISISKSGIGISTGVKGMRAGIDSKQRAYVSAGKGPIRYKEYLTGPKLKKKASKKKTY